MIGSTYFLFGFFLLLYSLLMWNVSYVFIDLLYLLKNYSISSSLEHFLSSSLLSNFSSILDLGDETENYTLFILIIFFVLVFFFNLSFYLVSLMSFLLMFFQYRLLGFSGFTTTNIGWNQSKWRFKGWRLQQRIEFIVDKDWRNKNQILWVKWLKIWECIVDKNHLVCMMFLIYQ